MKILEAAEYMSSMYLERIVKSFAGEFPKRDEDSYRQELRNNEEVLSSSENTRTRFEKIYNNAEDPYSEQLLLKFLLKSLLSKPDNIGNENELVKEVIDEENKIISDSQESENLKHLDQNTLEVFKSVLSVALEDSIITQDEMRLIDKLRNKLSINEKDQFLIQATLNLFPSQGNQAHTHKDIKSGLDDLQKCGIVFFCNRPDNSQEPFYVIPEEISPAIKDILGYELIESKYRLLLNQLTKNHLVSILKSFNFLTSGTKDELVERVIRVGIGPSQALESLPNNEIEKLINELQGVKKSGNKNERIRRIIEYFENLVIKDTASEESDPGITYYNYFEQLAQRDLKNLMPNNVVNKDRDIDNAFEEATRYLFEQKLNLSLLDMEGAEHCDGAVRFNKNGELFLWDNKSKLETDSYKFPDAHFRQFRRYIRNENQKGNRVNCFLIIVPSIDPEAERNAIKLKAESGVDCDVALINAENLKMIAESWQKQSERTYFNLDVFNTTGILDRETLKKHMRLFL